MYNYYSYEKKLKEEKEEIEKKKKEENIQAKRQSKLFSLIKSHYIPYAIHTTKE